MTIPPLLSRLMHAIFARRELERREAILRESRAPVVVGMPRVTSLVDKPQGPAALHSIIAERERRFARTMRELNDPDLADAARKSGAV